MGTQQIIALFARLFLFIVTFLFLFFLYILFFKLNSWVSRSFMQRDRSHSVFLMSKNFGNIQREAKDGKEISMGSAQGWGWEIGVESNSYVSNGWGLLFFFPFFLFFFNEYLWVLVGKFWCEMGVWNSICLWGFQEVFFVSFFSFDLIGLYWLFVAMRGLDFSWYFFYGLILSAWCCWYRLHLTLYVFCSFFFFFRASLFFMDFPCSFAFF